MKISVGKKLFFGYGFASGLLIIICIIAYLRIVQMVEITRKVTHTNEVLLKMENVVSALKDAETGQRGYLISKKVSYLEPYINALRVIPQELEGLKQLTIDNSDLQNKIKSLEPLIALRLAKLKEVIELNQSHGFDAASQRLREGEGKEIMDEIRKIVSTMEGHEREKLMIREKRAIQTSATTKQIIVYGTIISFVFLSLVGFLITRGITKSVALLVNQTQAIANGDFSSRLQIKSVDELGVLGSEINQMSERLEQALQAIAHEKNLLQRVMTNMTDGLVVSDLNENFLIFNPAAEKILGLGRTDSPSSKWTAEYGLFRTDKVTPVLREDLPMVRALRGEYVEQMELFVRNQWHPSGVWISVSASPLIESDKMKGGICVIRDNTAVKLAEQSICELNAELAEQNIELQSVNKELESFSYSVSHDLRAPLRSMMGFSKALLDDHESTLNAEGKDNLQRVVNAAQKMGQLIDGLLTMSRLSRIEMVKEKVNLSELAKEITQNLKSSEPTRDVDVSIEQGVIVEGDPQLLYVVLENLLGNAWKFTSKQKKANIEFGKSDEMGDSSCFIRDNGAGFDMRYSNKLFGAFQRLHTVKEFDGTGIGLATVQRIIHRHGGKIWADSKPEHGATFYFRFS